MRDEPPLFIPSSDDFSAYLRGLDGPDSRLRALMQQGDMPHDFLTHINVLSVEHQYVLALLFSIGQSHILEGWQEASLVSLDQLAHQLYDVERVFTHEGGLLGYHLLVTELLNNTQERDWRVFPPSPTAYNDPSPERDTCIIEALRHIDKLCELYPVGGAADRLNLTDLQTKMRLPAAKLEFLGKTLLEGIIDDVIAREYLAYKVYGKQSITPIGLMTSHERGNHEHIVALCKEHNWFNRGEDAFFLFSQPLVPCVDTDGKWKVVEPFRLEVKPGGHGMIWLLAAEKKVFLFFKRHGRSKILLRQINNPIAGTDSTLLAFTGHGLHHNKQFGFASCPRRIGAKEGMNVVVATEHGRVLTNLEYCDFERYGADDPDAGYEHYPANTNLLFADISAVEQALERNPFPGHILNFSDKGNGNVSARLETMMQNIADVIPEHASYLTITERNKTIATAKKEYHPGDGIFETPVGALYTYLENARELLCEYCHCEVPLLPTPDRFEADGGSFLFTYHPALGPLYSVIAQKIQGGHIAPGASCRLQIAELSLRNLALSGSLDISAESMTGQCVAGKRVYSEETGKCVLHDVCVEASLSIQLCGTSLFVAEHLVFDTDLSLVVPDGMIARAIATSDGIQVIYETLLCREGIRYVIEDDATISLDFSSLHSACGLFSHE